MIFVIYAHDIENSAARRAEFFPMHKAFLDTAPDYGVEIILSGPLVLDDGETRCGSLIVVNAETRASAEKFHHSDPFYQNEVWKSSTITQLIRSR